MTTTRIVIVGGPLRGKSSLAAAYALPVFCSDPKSLARNPSAAVTYLPEGLEWSEASAYVAETWFAMPGPWVIEGVATARALRKWAETHPTGYPCDRILVLHRPVRGCTIGQEAMAKGVATVWNGIAHRFVDVAELR